MRPYIESIIDNLKLFGFTLISARCVLYEAREINAINIGERREESVMERLPPSPPSSTPGQLICVITNNR